MKITSMLLAFILLSSIVGTAFAEANNESTDLAKTFGSVTVQELQDNIPLEITPNVADNPIDEISIIIDSLLAIGKKLWPIVQAGRPVINDKLIPVVSIIPRTDDKGAVLYQMSNWSVPRVKRYRVSFKNSYGSEVVGFTYTVYFQYNGSFAGVGKYVTSLKVEASEIYTSWGFNFDAVSELINIANVGSKDEPVASGILQVAYTVKGFLNEVRRSESFYVDGNGNIQLLNN